MLVKVKVIPKSKINTVIKKSSDSYVVSVKEKTEKGRANKAVLLLLADYFHINKGLIKLIKGGKQQGKIFEIPV